MEAYSTEWDPPGTWEPLVERAHPSLYVVATVGQIPRQQVEGAENFVKLLEARGITARLQRTGNMAHAVPPEWNQIEMELVSFAGIL